MKKPIAHGGDLHGVQERFPEAPLPWIDLSTGINPVPYPLPRFESQSWQRLPSTTDLSRLQEAAARRYGVRDPASVVAAPGTQALIQMLPRLVTGSRIAIVGPTYEEHEICWRRQGHDVAVVGDLADAAQADVVVVVNPDNPTGRLFPPDRLRSVPGRLVVDEAFIDFHPPHASLAADLPPGAIVLRSFGKTYGLAGVRLGFAIAEADAAERLREELGPWAVSGPAIDIACAVLADDQWLATASRRLASAAAQLDAILNRAGFTSLGGTALFRLCSHPRAALVVDALACQGIHVRTFERQPSWVRFGLPAHHQFERLAAALAQFSTAGRCDNDRAEAASSQTR